MYIAKQAVEDIHASCNNILALIEAVDVSDTKEEILKLTMRIKDNLSNTHNSLVLISSTLDDMYRKIDLLNLGIQEMMTEFDDIDMEGD